MIKSNTPVNQNFIQQAARQILLAVSEGKGSVLVKNPVWKFSELVKQGSYDDSLDSAYAEHLSSICFANTYLFHQQSEQTYGQMLENLLKAADFSLSAQRQTSHGIMAAVASNPDIQSVNAIDHPLGFDLFEEVKPDEEDPCSFFHLNLSMRTAPFCKEKCDIRRNAQ